MLVKFSVPLALLAGVSATASNLGANPIRRVVTLMQDMQKEIEAEGKKEDETYGKFKCYCSGSTGDLSKSAEEASALITELEAKIKEEKAEKKIVVEELKQAKRDRANAVADLKKATEIRKKEEKTYVDESGDTRSNIESITAAVAALEKGSGAFLQTPAANKLKEFFLSNSNNNMVSEMNVSDKEILVNFLQSTGDYVPASGQIIGILKNMKDDMDKSLGGIVSDEEKAVDGFKDLKRAKEKEIALATSVIEAKTQRSGELAVSIVQNENGKKDAVRDLDETQKFLANLDSTCKEKATIYEERVKTRQEEIAAISEAISVLNDDDALDVFKSAISKPKVAFLQMNKNVNKKVMSFINSKAMSSSKNAALNLLAHTITSKLSNTSGAVDFTSVIKMIDEMSALLKKEQSDDETHKKWCEGEFDLSEDEAKEVSQKIAALESSISDMRDEISNLGEKITSLKADNGALDKSVAEATSQRNEEHAEYMTKVQLNEAAIQLIFKAKNRLQKFYNPDQYVEAPKAEPTEEELNSSFKVSFLQTAKLVSVSLHKQENQNEENAKPEPMPEVGFEGAYQAKGQKSNSVMALMDMLTKDLEKDVQEAEHDEKVAQKDYQELLTDAQETKAANTKSIQDKSKSKADLETSLEDTKQKNIMANDQLTNVKSYVQDLHQSCDFILANFEVRREARTAERESLSNAKAVLNGANFS